MKRKPITDDTYYTRLIRYVHYNPVHHGFVLHPNDWPHSSYHALSSDKATRLYQEEVWEWFGDRQCFLESHQEIPLIPLDFEPLITSCMSMYTEPSFRGTKFRIGGMLVGYYRICPRKAWLSMRGLSMEQESEAVALGRLVDAHTYDRANKHLELEAEAPDGTPLIGKIDRANLKAGVLHETKKGRSCEDAHRWQVRFYLWLLHRNGVARPDGSPFLGQLDYPLLRKSESVSLESEHIAELAATVQAIRQVAAQDVPPPRLTKRTFCTKCAFEELCYG